MRQKNEGDLIVIEYNAADTKAFRELVGSYQNPVRGSGSIVYSSRGKVLGGSGSPKAHESDSRWSSFAAWLFKRSANQSARRNPSEPTEKKAKKRYALTPGDKSGLAWIVGNFHVGEPDSVIEADIRRRLEKGNTPKPLITLAVKHAIKTHHKNQALYRSVMTGR